MFNPSFPYRLMHTVTAAYLTTALVVGGAGAWHLLAGRRDAPEVRVMFSMAMWMATIVAPIQILAGDQHGLNTLEHQPVKIMAMEGHFESHKDGAPLFLFGWPLAWLWRTRRFLADAVAVQLTRDPDALAEPRIEPDRRRAPGGIAVGRGSRDREHRGRGSVVGDDLRLERVRGRGRGVMGERPAERQPLARAARQPEGHGPVTAPQPADTSPQPGDEVIAEPPSQKIANRSAMFSGLDKITGRIIAFDAAIGETVQFGALQVTAAHQAGLSDVLMAASNSSGGVLGTEMLYRHFERDFRWIYGAGPAP